MITPALWARLLKYVKQGDETSIVEVLSAMSAPWPAHTALGHQGGISAVVMMLDETIKLLGRAVCGGPWTAKDNQRLDELCRMIGHQP